MKVVLDTNVLFAAFVSQEGLCAKVVEAVLAEHTLVLSRYILTELARHLEGKTKLSKQRVADGLAALAASAETVEPVTIPIEAVRDPKDGAILGTALAAVATMLVSGDKDLLVIGRYQAVEILSPRAFHDRYCARAKS